MTDFISGASAAKYCTNCGEVLAPNSAFCTACGSPVAPPPVQGQYQSPQAGVSSTDVPREICHWSWPAFLFTWIWAFPRGVYTWAIIGLAADLWSIPAGQDLFSWHLLPTYGVMIFLGLKGNELAWKTGRFRDVTHFRAVQSAWMTAFWIFLPIIAVICIASRVLTK